MLLLEIWLAKMQAGNLGFSTLVSCWLVGFWRFGGFVIVGLGGFGLVGFCSSSPHLRAEENLKKALFLMTKQVCVS